MENTYTISYVCNGVECDQIHGFDSQQQAEQYAQANLQSQEGFYITYVVYPYPY